MYPPNPLGSVVADRAAYHVGRHLSTEGTQRSTTNDVRPSSLDFCRKEKRTGSSPVLFPDILDVLDVVEFLDTVEILDVLDILDNLAIIPLSYRQLQLHLRRPHPSSFPLHLRYLQHYQDQLLPSP